LRGFADLAEPVCRRKDEPRPTCAIVHARTSPLGGAVAPSLTDLARRASTDTRVGTKEWALQVEQKNGRSENGAEKSGLTEIGLDSAPAHIILAKNGAARAVL
jgi:hypothetical protein